MTPGASEAGPHGTESNAPSISYIRIDLELACNGGLGGGGH